MNASYSSDIDWTPAATGTCQPTVLHVCTPGAWIGIRNGQLTVTLHGNQLAQIPLVATGLLCCHSRAVTVSGAALAACMAENIPVAWFARNGKYAFRIMAPDGNDVEKRRQQMACCEDPHSALDIARWIIQAKISSQMHLLNERRRSSGTSIRGSTAVLRKMHERLTACESAASLRGVEGRIARLYFRSIARTLPADISFLRRSRPADGIVNACLNLLYTQLTQRADAHLRASGFDPGIAPLHQHNRGGTAWGRPNLACDLVEPLRATLVDNFVWAGLSRRRWSASDCTPDRELGTRLKPPALAAILTAWESHWQQHDGWGKIASLSTAMHQAFTAHSRNQDPVSAMEDSAPISSIYIDRLI